MTDRSKGDLKRVVKLGLSAGFFVGCWVWNRICRLFGRNARGSCVVLYYHGITREQRPYFAGQMDALVRWTKPVRADIQGPLTDGIRHAAVTFDDGFRNVIENALPELKRRGIPATLFIVPAAFGESPTWEKYSSGHDRWEAIMTEDELCQLPFDLVSIGSHSLTHPILPMLSEDKARKELRESRAVLEQRVKRAVKLFSFPYGAFNEELVEWCRKAGYERVFTTLPQLAFSTSHEFVTGRVGAEPTDWRIEFYLKLFGAYRWLPLAFSLKRRILLNLRRLRPTIPLATNAITSSSENCSGGKTTESGRRQ